MFGIIFNIWCCKDRWKEKKVIKRKKKCKNIRNLFIVWLYLWFSQTERKLDKQAFSQEKFQSQDVTKMSAFLTEATHFTSEPIKGYFCGGSALGHIKESHVSLILRFCWELLIHTIIGCTVSVLSNYWKKEVTIAVITKALFLF